MVVRAYGLPLAALLSQPSTSRQYRGALADLISNIPEIGAGVAYVREEGSPDVTRVRAAYVSHEQIKQMCEAL